MTPTREVRLACGCLRIRVRRAELPLDHLLDFASRRNPRRGFLFVSRLLGKHLPAAPAAMRDGQERLARQLADLPGPVLTIGMAETATGLGGGVADSLARLTGRTDILFQQTTRYRIDAPLLERFDEAHSHAPDHLLHAPDPALADDWRAAASLVLVDDEITTGRTLALLAERLLPHLPRLRAIRFASLVNWLTPEARTEIAARLALPLDFPSLLDGEFVFEPAPNFQPVLPATAAAIRPAPYPARADTGRRGLRMPLDASRAAERLAADLPRDRQLRVIGAGEFAYQPFLLAEALERLGFDTAVQGSTRSPILPGGAIASSLDCDDEEGEGVRNYLHNPPPPQVHPLLAYEAPHQPGQHGLAERLGAAIWVLDADAHIDWRPPRP